VLREGHDIATVGHPRGRKIYKVLRQSFYWIGMKREIERYVQTCEECQKNKTLKRKKARLLQSLVMSSRAWEFIIMDFIMQLPKTAKGKTVIMVVVDRLSKQCHLVTTEMKRYQLIW
jgi:Integrase zinc binding domain